jgi:DMSO/TMAO reductase YedYZ molybdopterin-dependent catalytic subunit
VTSPLTRLRGWSHRIDAVARRRLPSPTDPLGAPPARSDLHDERVAAILGIGLGVCFTVCFATGMYSHLEQHPETWLPIPTMPAGLYRVTQGVHVATGIASIPLLFAKLWAVWPRFVSWPAVTGVAHAVERLSLVPLVGGSLFQVVTGVSNIFHWYWFPFFFTTTHYDAAFVVIGALLTHLLAKWTVTRSALRRDGPKLSRPPTAPGLLTRRGFLWTVGAASAVLTVGTVGEALGQPVPALQATDLLAPRRPGTGPQGFPVNRPASEAGVTHLAGDLSGYRFRVDGPGAPRPVVLSIAEVRALPRHRSQLPIACVEGWSVSRLWEGVRVADL